MAFQAKAGHSFKLRVSDQNGLSATLGVGSSEVRRDASSRHGD